MEFLTKLKNFKFILIIILIISSILIYRSDQLMFKGISYLKIKSSGLINLNKYRNTVMHLVDDINPFKGKYWNQKFNLPIINIKLNNSDLEHFQNIIDNAKSIAKYTEFMPNDINTPLNVDIYFDNLVYKSEIKLHGTNNPHFINEKKSYSFKIRNKEKKTYPYGMKRFSLIIPDQSNHIAMFTYQIADLLGMMVPKNFLVRLNINGIDQGVYHLEEKLNKTLLERNGKSGFDVVRSDDSWAHQYSDNHGTMFSFDYSGLQNRFTSGKALNQKVLIKEVLNSDNISFIKKHLNINEFIKYDVLRYIFGDSGHMTSNDNIKFVYDTSTARLEPYFRIENHIEEIQPNRLSYIPERHVNIGLFTQNKLLVNLTRDDSYRNKRNRELYKLLEKKDLVLEIFEKNINQNLPVLLNDTTNYLPSRYFKYETNLAKQNLENNFNFLLKYLEYSRVFIELIKQDEASHELLIKPDSNSPIKANLFKLIVDEEHIGKKLKLIDTRNNSSSTLLVVSDNNGNGIIDLKTQLSDHEFSLSLNQDLEPEKNIYKFILLFDGEINKTEINFFNDITKKDIIKSDTYVDIINESNFIKESLKFPFTKIDDNELLIKKGIYNFTESIVIPHGYNLTIEKGTKLILDRDVNILLQGSLKIEGEKLDKVFIKSKSESPFGSFAAIGDGETDVNINYLELSGGSEAFINGIHLIGALSLYNHNNVIIKNSSIFNNVADDGLNIKYANVHISDNQFFSNTADQFDLDSGSGVIENNIFLRKSKENQNINFNNFDSNGDGLDLSDSLIEIKNNLFDGFVDKGISVGEKTTALVFKNTFQNNRSSVTVKDESKVYLYKNKYQNNSIQLEMYQKKLFFDHPTVYNIDDRHTPEKIFKSANSKYYKSNNKINFDYNLFDKKLIETLNNEQWILYE